MLPKIFSREKAEIFMALLKGVLEKSRHIFLVRLPEAAFTGDDDGNNPIDASRYGV